jgi:hypothetical protein
MGGKECVFPIYPQFGIHIMYRRMNCLIVHLKVQAILISGKFGFQLHPNVAVWLKFPPGDLYALALEGVGVIPTKARDGHPRPTNKLRARELYRRSCGLVALGWSAGLSG